MLTITREVELSRFDAWSGGKDRLDKIIELGIEGEAEDYIRELGSGTMSEGDLNDILWFEMDDFISQYDNSSDDEYDDEDGVY